MICVRSNLHPSPQNASQMCHRGICSSDTKGHTHRRWSRSSTVHSRTSAVSSCLSWIVGRAFYHAISRVQVIRGNKNTAQTIFDEVQTICQNSIFVRSDLQNPWILLYPNLRASFKGWSGPKSGSGGHMYTHEFDYVGQPDSMKVRLRGAKMVEPKISSNFDSKFYLKTIFRDFEIFADLRVI